jgi:hypothetical protein
MLREPRLVEMAPQLCKGQKKSRFQLMKLEERIAPRKDGDNDCDDRHVTPPGTGHVGKTHHPAGAV